MRRAQLARTTLEELGKRIQLAEKNKKNLVNHFYKLKRKYSDGEISYSQYIETIHVKKDKRNIKEWIEYYDSYIKKCQKRIKEQKKIIITKQFSVIFFSLFFIFLLFIASFYIQPTFTGFFVQEQLQKQTFTEQLNLKFNQSEIYEWQIENSGVLNSVKLSGSIKGEGQVKIYLGDLLVLDSYSEELKEETSQIQEDLSPSHEESLQSSGLIIKFTDICEETCDLSEFNLNKTSYTLRIEISNATLNLDTITYEIFGEIVEEVPEEIGLDISEKKTKKGKEISISIPEYLNDTFISAEIPNEWNIKNKNSLKVHWKEGNKDLDFDSYDLDNDGKIDEIEWVVPATGDQTFEIIVITKAEHLDENREFINDIYEEVRALDDIWSETISSEDYIRVTFEQELDNTRDITLYPRIINGTPRIEVYEINGTELIAEFESLNDNEYNKIYLTSLQGSQDVFDLKVVGGSVELDHIIDPTFEYYFTGFEADAIEPWDGWTGGYEVIRTSSGVGGDYCSDNSCPGTGSFAIEIRDDTVGSTLSQTFGLSNICNGGVCDEVNISFWAWFDVDNSNGEGLDLYCDSNIIWSCFPENGDNPPDDSAQCSGDMEGAWIYFEISLSNPELGSCSVDSSVSLRFEGEFQNNNRHVWLDGINISGSQSGPPDTNYPQFSNYGDNNGTLLGGGTGSFNATVTSTNGTVWLEIDGNNISATNLGSNIYVVNHDFTDPGIYPYKWHSWGNGSRENYNKSIERNYTVEFTYGTLDVNIFYPVDDSNFRQGDSNLTVNATVTCVGGSCGTVYASARYNASSSAATTLIDITTGAIPFFAMGGIGNINSPVQAGYLTDSNLNGAHAVSVSGDYAYVASYRDDSLTIIDISTPSNPTQVGYLTNTSSMNGAYSVSVSGDYAYVASYTDDSLTIIDISTPSNPTQVGYLQNLISMNGAYSVSVSGDYAYIASYFSDSLTIIDISTPSNPTQVGYLTNSNLDGANSVYALGDYAYVTSYRDDSLTIIDISTHSNPIQVGYLTNSNLNSANSVYALGDYAYVTSYTGDSLTIINISTPSSPTQVGYLTNPSTMNGANSVYALGDYAYVTSYTSDSLTIINISTPSSPTQVGYLTNPSTMNGANSVYALGDYAYVTSYTSDSLTVIDVSAGASNPISIIDFKLGDSFNFFWKLNVTSSLTESYLINVLFNSSHGNLNVPDNITEHRLVNFNVDLAYPQFSNYWDNNASFVEGEAGFFNVTVTSTNGTVLLEIDGNNISASNVVADVYNVSYNFISPGIYSYRWHSWGNGTSNNYNKSIERNYTVLNFAPSITHVFNESMTDVSGGLNSGPFATYVEINFTVYDVDGAFNLNSSSAKINFSKSGETTRESVSCFQYEIGEYYANYTCSVTMGWWDGAGTWSITAYIEDNSAEFAQNDSAVFQVGETTGFEISPSSLSWPLILVGGTNFTSNNDPILLNNTGNKNIGIGSIQINATDLFGEKDSNYGLFAGNFSISWETSGDSSPNVECAGTQMNVTAGNYVNITTANLTRGDYRINDGSTGQEELYVCLRYTGSEVINQPYSTQQTGSWAIRILLVVVLPKRRKKKKKKKKTKVLLDKFSIPATIFSKELGALETIVKFMKENLDLNYSEIANLINRDDRTIWTAYKKASEKKEGKIKIEETKIFIPISIFKNRKLTILESVIIYLKEKGLRYSEVAELIDRNQRNVWTVYSRAMKKIERKDIASLTKEVGELNIQVTIFSNKLGALESITKYMKENLGLSYNEIAELLNRNDRTIWTAYKKAIEKKEGKIKIEETKIFIPVSIFENRKLTILESMIIYLKQEGMKYNEIAGLINRDQRNVWTVHSRAIRKIKN